MDLLRLPAIRVIIAHTADRRNPTSQVRTIHSDISNSIAVQLFFQMDCAQIVRNIQDEHMQIKNWDDIGYNFSVGGDGSIYVGRGWNYKGAHSRVYNQNSICIAFIGNFWKTQPSNRALIAAQRLMEEGVRTSKLTQDYRLYGHRQLIPTSSPGNELYRIIQQWGHFSEEVIPP